MPHGEKWGSGMKSWRDRFGFLFACGYVGGEDGKGGVGQRPLPMQHATACSAALQSLQHLHHGLPRGSQVLSWAPPLGAKTDPVLPALSKAWHPDSSCVMHHDLTPHPSSFVCSSSCLWRRCEEQAHQLRLCHGIDLRSKGQREARLSAQRLPQKGGPKRKGAKVRDGIQDGTDQADHRQEEAGPDP